MGTRQDTDLEWGLSGYGHYLRTCHDTDIIWVFVRVQTLRGYLSGHEEKRGETGLQVEWDPCRDVGIETTHLESHGPEGE